MPEIKIEDVLTRVSALEQRLDAFESSSVPTEKKIKSHADLMRVELKDLDENPEDHIERRVSFGAKRDDAVKAVEARKAFIRSELGLKPAVKAAKKAAALILFLFALAFSATAADYQGYSSASYATTNLPVLLPSATAVFYSLNSQATNYIPLRSKSGLAVQWIGAGTNSLVTNALGTAQIWFYPSVDGTNAFGNALLGSLQMTPNITNAVITGTNWNELTLRGYSGLFYTISNGTSLPLITSGTITNVQNGATNYYSAGLFFNRPN